MSGVTDQSSHQHFQFKQLPLNLSIEKEELGESAASVLKIKQLV